LREYGACPSPARRSPFDKSIEGNEQESQTATQESQPEETRCNR